MHLSSRARHIPARLFSRLRLKCDGTRAEIRFYLSVKSTSPFKSAGALVQSTTGSRSARIGGRNARYTVIQGGVKGTGYPLHSPVSPSLPHPCVTVCHHFSSGFYLYYTSIVSKRVRVTICTCHCALRPHCSPGVD